MRKDHTRHNTCSWHLGPAPRRGRGQGRRKHVHVARGDQAEVQAPFYTHLAPDEFYFLERDIDHNIERETEDRQRDRQTVTTDRQTGTSDEAQTVDRVSERDFLQYKTKSAHWHLGPLIEAVHARATRRADRLDHLSTG